MVYSNDIINILLSDLYDYGITNILLCELSDGSVF